MLCLNRERGKRIRVILLMGEAVLPVAGEGGQFLAASPFLPVEIWEPGFRQQGIAQGCCVRTEPCAAGHAGIIS